MACQYHVYANSSAGGPVDYSVPLATVAGTTFTPPALAPGSDTIFAVRAFDPASGLEESNVDARVRIVLDAEGNDVSGRPASVIGLTASPRAGGAMLVSWLYNPLAAAPPPSGYRVYLGSPTPDYTTPIAQCSFTGARQYHVTVPGLSDRVTYQVAVRAYNGAGEEPSTSTVRVVALCTGPTQVDGLVVFPTFEG